MKQLLLVLMFGVLTASCVTKNNVKNRFVERGGLDRAVFELDCPKEKITITAINRSQVGVTGCGKKSIYVMNPNGYGWINNTALEQQQ